MSEDKNKGLDYIFKMGIRWYCITDFYVNSDEPTVICIVYNDNPITVRYDTKSECLAVWVCDELCHLQNTLCL